MNAKSLALFLGAFSVGLGAVELFAPGALARFLGTRRRGVVRAFGVREIAAGVGIFARPSRPGPLWVRVAGDALDLAALGTCLRDATPRTKRNVAVACASVAGVTALDVLAARANA